VWDEDIARQYGLEWTPTRREFPQTTLVVASLDTAFKEKEESDFNALTIWGIFLDKARNRRAMLMYAWQKRLPLNGRVLTALAGETGVAFRQRQQQEWGLVDWVAHDCARYGVKRLLIEDKSRGHDVANELKRLYRRDNWGVQMINPVADKVSRAHSVVPLFTDNAVYAPNTTWADLVISNCEDFPKGAHDDLLDSCTQFLNWARENDVLVLADEMSAALDDAATYQPPRHSVAQQYGV
jgi:predicted phage terminase large subunit-like protein